jgi:hypothetical protein
MKKYLPLLATFFLVLIVSIIVYLNKLKTVQFEQKMIVGKEANAWLMENKNDAALASNHFGTTNSARMFVKNLYQSGANSVIVPDSCIYNDLERIEKERGPYANCLVVKMPPEAEKWEPVLAICKKELDQEYKNLDLRKEVNEGHLFLWWD